MAKPKNDYVHVVLLFVNLKKNIEAYLHECNFYITFAL